MRPVKLFNIATYMFRGAQPTGINELQFWAFLHAIEEAAHTKTPTRFRHRHYLVEHLAKQEDRT